jgi:hypothetical protein
VHYQTIGYPERGEYSPSLYLALRIAAHFEVPVPRVALMMPAPISTTSGLSDSGVLILVPPCSLA